jgi:Fe-S cluster assembly iron-binding protein IscA
MSYSMTFAENVGQVASMLDCGAFKLLINPVALGFLEGAEIDYVTEGLNSGFVFRNASQSVGGSGKCPGCGGGASSPAVRFVRGGMLTGSSKFL